MDVDPLDILLNFEMSDQVQQLARQLVESDAGLMAALRDRRLASGLSTVDVAARMGIAVADVMRLERADADPKLSTLRRYALAIGVLVRHEICAPAAEHGGITR